MAPGEELRAPTAIRRSPRRDATENRAKLIFAASALFGEHGTDASLEDVAARAGLNPATLYRRFPNKEALITECVHAIIAHVVDLARSEAESTDGRGLERWLWTYADIQARKRGLASRFWDNDDVTNPMQAELRRLMTRLVEQAKERRRIRLDADATDIALIFFALRGIAESVPYEDAVAWRRCVALLLAGLRPSRRALADPPWPLPKPAEQPLAVRRSGSRKAMP